MWEDDSISGYIYSISSCCWLIVEDQPTFDMMSTWCSSLCIILCWYIILLNRVMGSRWYLLALVPPTYSFFPPLRPDRQFDNSVWVVTDCPTDSDVSLYKKSWALIASGCSYGSRRSRTACMMLWAPIGSVWLNQAANSKRQKPMRRRIKNGLLLQARGTRTHPVWRDQK